MHLPSYTTQFFSAVRATSGILLFGLAAACGGGGGGDTNPSVNLPPVNRAPTLEQFSPIDVLEGSQISVAVVADDADGDPLDVSLSGSDVAFFEYSADSGIQFAQIPDWEANEDADGNNVFEVTASVSDGNLSSSSLLTVTVVDALEGSVVNGPMSNSLVFIDENNNAVLDTGEISTYTRTNGLFFLPHPDDPTDLPLLAHGGTDELTGNELASLELRTVLKNASTEHIGINLFTTMAAPLNSVEREAFDELLGDNIELEVVSHLDIWRASIDGSEDAKRAARLNLQLGLLVLTAEALATGTSDVAGVLAHGFLISSNQLAGQALRDSEALSHLISPVVDENNELDFGNSAINTIATSLANINEVTSNSDIRLTDPILSDVMAIGQLALKDAISSFIETGSYETFETSVAIETLLGPLSSNIESENTDGDSLIDLLDPDDDNDNVNDSTDAFPRDGQEWTDTDGDGIGNNADWDDDNDGVADESDAFPLDDSESIDTDGDETGNNADEDDDNDGVDDIVDAFPLDPFETLDTDNDGIGNNADGDDDGDDVPDEDDAFPLDPSEQIDTDQDGIGNNSDIDDDNDGYIDDIDAFPLDPLEHLDTDLDGIGNNSDEDDDGDGVDDIADLFPLDPSEAFDNDGDGIGDNGDSDDDNDGTPDTSDAFPFDPTEDTDTDNDGVGNNADLDDDNDGVDDASDALPLDPTETEDSDGDGIGNNADTDDDNDGVNDSADAFPLDPTEATDTDNDGIGNNTDPDDDNDGVDDGADAFPLDPTESIDTDGDGTGNNADSDDDGDGVADSEDAFPLDPTETVDTDSDGVGNNTDTDDDDDGIEDSVDAFPLDPTESVDTDSDGIGNNADTDDDGDGVLDEEDAFPLDPTETVDTDGDGVGNSGDDDDDGDGVPDGDDAFPLDPTETLDTDGDGIGNNADSDDDGDGVPDVDDVFPLDPTETLDTDGDGIGNNADSDDDGDGVADIEDAFPLDPTETTDTDGDGNGNNTDTDDDNDGVADTEDAFPLDPTETVDTDGDGVGNNADEDDDGDGVNDDEDAYPLDPNESRDTDGDGIGDKADTDDDADTVPDTEDNCPLISNTSQLDTDGDGDGNSCDLDDDNDTIEDGNDNCPLTPNPDQLDSDGDGWGDACGGLDDDDDTIPNAADNCPTIPNEDQLDTDSDGEGDVCDSDDDGDGIDDVIDPFPLDPNIKALPTVDGASLSLKSMPGSTAATVATNATAQDNRTVTYSLVSEPSYGTVAFSTSNNTLTYSTLEKSKMTDSFSYKASDGFSESLPAGVDINMTGDPLFKHQWHLDNTGQTNFSNNYSEIGNDLRTESALKSGLTGQNVIIAVVDDGLEIAHEDLAPNVVEGGSYDLKDDDTDPTLEAGDGGHGTSVAGIIAARGWNDIGARGVAPSAALKGFNYLEAQGLANYISAFGGEDYSNDVDIFNYSAGMVPRRAFTVLSGMQQAVITETLPSLRDGKGALFIKSAGNDFGRRYEGCDYPDEVRFSCIDSITDSHHIYQQVIVTAALAADGKKSSYSSAGATTWISGFGGEYGSSEAAIMTTDQSGCDRGYVQAGLYPSNEFDDGDNPHPENPDCNYTSSFNGTSSAAPSVSGGIALILEQKPELTFRDVKGIIAATARKVDTDFEPVVLDGITYYNWVDNAAGYSHHSWYGFGALDVDAAIEMLADYNLSTLGDQTISPWDDHASETVVSVPAENEATASVESTLEGTIEFVRIRLDLGAPGIQQMGVRLTSPAGTTVTLFQPKTPIDIDPEGVIYLATSALYGESTQGTWTLRLFDHEDDGLDITLNAWAIKFFYY